MRLPKNAKVLPFAPSYYVTNEGEVFSFISGRFLKLSDNGIGYKQVWLRLPDGKCRWFKVHRLVALMFVPNVEPVKRNEVNHIDNNKANNHYKNLEWVSHKENIAHAKKLGLLMGGGKGMKGKEHTKEAKKAMSEAKLGVKHPKFKGFYTYQGLRYPSLNMLAKALGVYPVKVHRMFKAGIVGFESVL